MLSWATIGGWRAWRTCAGDYLAGFLTHPDSPGRRDATIVKCIKGLVALYHTSPSRGEDPYLMLYISAALLRCTGGLTSRGARRGAFLHAPLQRFSTPNRTGHSSIDLIMIRMGSEHVPGFLLFFYYYVGSLNTSQGRSRSVGLRRS